MKNDIEMYQSLLLRYEEYQKRKKKRFHMIGLAAPVLACFCLAVSFSLGFFKSFVSLPEISVQNGSVEVHGSASTAPSHTLQSSTAAASHTVTTTTAASAAKTSETQPLAEADDHVQRQEQYSDAEDENELPAETKAPAPTEQTVQTTAAEVTEPYIDDNSRLIEGTMPHLLDSDDPITIFSVISFDGKDFEGCRYINAENAERFYISWQEETTITAYDSRRDKEIREPVIINGLRDREDKQEYIIIKFTSYDMYGLYEAIGQPSEEQPSEEQPTEQTLIDNE